MIVNYQFSIRGIVNYKELDTQKIKDYILSHPDGVEVEDISDKEELLDAAAYAAHCASEG